MGLNRIKPLSGLALIAIVLLTVAACGGTSKEEELEQIVNGYWEAAIQQDWATIYRYYSADYKSECSASGFASMMAFAWPFFGLTEESIFVLDKVLVVEDKGWYGGRFELDGKRLDFSELTEWRATNPDVDDPAFLFRGGTWEVVPEANTSTGDGPC